MDAQKKIVSALHHQITGHTGTLKMRIGCTLPWDRSLMTLPTGTSTVGLGDQLTLLLQGSPVLSRNGNTFFVEPELPPLPRSLSLSW